MPYSRNSSQISYAQAIANYSTCMKTLEDIRHKDFSSRMIKYYKQQICYFIQQICEVMLKIQVLETGIPVNNLDYKRFRHDLYDIWDYATYTLQISIDIPQEILNNLTRITSWEVEGRYDCCKVVQLRTLEKMLEVIGDWINRMTRGRKIHNPYRY